MIFHDKTRPLSQPKRTMVKEKGKPNGPWPNGLYTGSNSQSKQGLLAIKMPSGLTWLGEVNLITLQSTHKVRV